MIEIKKYLLLIMLMPFLVVCQDNELQGFENLVDKTWVAAGEWSNGSPFKQEVVYSFGLNNTVVLVNSKGFTNQEQTEFGDRNHGIRQYNKEKNQIDFWEFDVFGGVTQGVVNIKENNIWYHYKYGDTSITDCWEYLDNESYKFTVGSFKDNKWETIYLQTVFKLKE